MKINFLGTNNWFDTHNGNTICTLIDTQKAYIIIDAGYGISKAKKYIKEDKPIYLFISHLHLDHICGLHGMCGFCPKQKFSLVCNQEFKKYLKKIINPPFSSPLGNGIKNFEIIDIDKNKKDIPFKFKTAKLNHTTTTFGYRFEIENKVITYCLDTGFSKNAVKIGKNSDILIYECSLGSNTTNETWGHSSPQTGAKTATLANTQKLVLNGFSPNAYKDKNSKKEAEINAKKIFKNTISAFDGMTINL